MNAGGLLRWGLTIGIIAVAVLFVVIQYKVYFRNPWTRDGLVQTQVVQLASRITGPISAVHVADNQLVKKDDVLFEIDESTSRIALELATAALEQKQSLARQAQDNASRAADAARAAPGAVAQQTLQDTAEQALAAHAAVRMAQATWEQARLNLSFTRITAPVDGYITNLTAQVGTMAVAYEPFVALLEAHHFWVDGFFRETLIAGLKPGDKAVVTLMTYPDIPLEGTVSSIGWGIAQQNGSTGTKLLPNVSPTFEWVRLAQRIPVRITLTHVPEGVTLRMGTTASVLVRIHPDDRTVQANTVPALPRALQ